MASSKGYLTFILDQLAGLDGLSYWGMMGEYILYCRGKIFGGVYDDRLLLRPTPTLRERMPLAREEVPYAGAKPMLLADNVEDGNRLRDLVEAAWAELPPPKTKRRT